MTGQAANPSPRSPERLDDALSLLAQPGWLPLAGGTDVYPAHVGRPVSRPILDLSRIDALRGQSRVAGVDGRSWWRIGALESWMALRETVLPAGFEALPQAAAEVGGRQIQNQATIGGNLCNASPAADGVPALLALDAEAELQSRHGTRRLPLSKFVLGNRRTALTPDELLVAVLVPIGSPRARSQFLKLGHRRYLVISIAMVTVSIDSDEHGALSRCAIAVGACSAAAQRLPHLESRLMSAPRDQAAHIAAQLLASSESQALLEALSPIDDVRGTAAYRREAVRELIVRAIGMACSSLSSSELPQARSRS
ncbi:MAG: xanthine dehydrogenase family protein subunit M [Betaproteobacteria bacterium]|nr:xanthine dehydrogenase family protein subunit M [Betaproteobacteria bacterium]